MCTSCAGRNQQDEQVRGGRRQPHKPAGHPRRHREQGKARQDGRVPGARGRQPRATGSAQSADHLLARHRLQHGAPRLCQHVLACVQSLPPTCPRTCAARHVPRGAGDHRHSRMSSVCLAHSASLQHAARRSLLKASDGRSARSAQDSALEEVGNLSWGAFKPVLADAIIAHLAPLQRQYAAVMSDPAYLDQVQLLIDFTHPPEPLCANMPVCPQLDAVSPGARSLVCYGRAAVTRRDTRTSLSVVLTAPVRHIIEFCLQAGTNPCCHW